jgi:hypothetical protein
MNEPAATLDVTIASGAAVAPRDGGAQRGGGMKFTFASGSRPLEGFTIKRGVGIGGFGEVYFALSEAGKEVALKRVQRNLEIELRGVSQCLNLKHMNLVDLYDIKYDDQGGAWVVMEYITGESLKDVIDRNPRGIPQADVLHWFTGMARGVAYLHDQGIVHRDLKPGNIFDDQGIIKIGDYGLAKFISCSRRSGQTESVGTFHYMAPEIGKGSYGKEIDIYALGIMLFEMLTGKVPFDGESSQEIIMRHLTEDADTSQLPLPFRGVVARALGKDPELRYSHVDHMLQDLAQASEPHPAGAEAVVAATMVPPSPPPRGAAKEVLYIGDDPPPSDMAFGPVRHRPGTQASLAQVQQRGRALAHAARPAGATSLAQREPVAQAVSRGTQRASSWWRNSPLSTGSKILLVMGLLAVLFFNAEWVTPLGVAVGVLYAIYLGVWLLVQGSQASPPEATSGIRFRSWQELVRENLRGKPLGVRLGELSGAWLAAAVIAALLSVVMIAASDQFASEIDTLSAYAWLAVATTLGTWAVLAVGKFCEGVESDAIRRRVVMLGLGLALGAAAFGLEQALLMNLSNSPASVEASPLLASEGTPRLPLFLVFFGGLFVVPGWWKQTDPLRKTRINIFKLGTCVVWGYLLSLLWPFPQPWGVMLAATISLTAQLAAPWMTAQQRDAAKREYRRA